jgi:tRNA (adenine-N(1)-)-methyltransferase non-catalytic subunit
MNASVSMEEISHSSENVISDLGAENAENSSFPALRACKAIKAGEKASQEMIDSWKENGFSRYLNYFEVFDSLFKKS